MNAPARDRRHDPSERLDLGLAGVGSWEWDPHSGAFSLSPTCRRLLQLPHTHVAIADLSELIHPDDVPRLLSLAGDCLRGEAEVRTEFRVRDDGGWRWIEAAGRRLRRAAEPAGHVVGIAVDVTRRKHAEAERELWQGRTQEALARLEQTAHRTGDLLQVTGHDLRTPLNAVLGWCHILARQSDRSDLVRDVVEVIERNAWALARIIDGMAKRAHGLVEVPDAGGQQAAATAPTAEAPPLAAERLQGVRVLVVDDDRDNREWVRQILVQEGADVDAAATCAEGLDLYGRNRPDVIVSDIDLPDQDGYSLLRLLRAHGGGRSVPAVAVTALTRSADARAAFDAGFQAHMAKPVRPGELCAAIRRLASASAGGGRDQAGPDGAAAPARRTP